MTYTQKVKFTSTNRYGCGPADEDDVYTVEEFKERCKTKCFVDYDGFGHPVKDSKCDPNINIYPSECHNIPEDATHVVWYNK